MDIFRIQDMDIRRAKWLQRVFVVVFLQFFCILGRANNDSLPLLDFKEAIENAKEKGTGQAQLFIWREAIQSGKIEWTRACFDAGLPGLQEAFKEEGDLRNKVLTVLAVLTGSPSVWMDDPRSKDYQIQHLALYRFCEPTLKQYLPSDLLSERNFLSASERAKVAGLFVERLLAAGLLRKEELK